MNIHTGTKNYLCKYCGTGFTDTANRRMHERTVHEGFKRSEKNKGGSLTNSNLPKCTHCEKVFSRYEKLKNHIKNVHEEQNVVSTGAEKNEKNVHEEGKHIVTETTTSSTSKPKSHQKELVCVHCNMVLSRADTLKKHYKNVHNIMKGPQRKNVHEGQNQEEKEGNQDEYNKSTGKSKNFAGEKTLTPPDSPTISTT